MPNQLIHETSPYLLQHAHNPVDWLPWGAEALQRALDENKPIFLSIGYAACHWCHVMAHESFEDPETAALINQYFIPIKVDREERPDVDSLYMSAVVAINGQGGWPMSLFLTPDGQPFYGGTYFPREPRYGAPAFTQVLTAAARAWQEDPAEVRRTGHDLLHHIAAYSEWGAEEGLQIRENLLEQAAQGLVGAYDWQHGGWGQAPLFPQAMALEFLLLQASAGNAAAEQTAFHNLEIMSRGGLYDVVGGGFHRYSTDSQWRVPHFEKMLYDNAQLALVYLHAGTLADRPDFLRVATETLDFILREMTYPEGGFFASLDADSDGEEGLFYLWSNPQVKDALQPSGDYDWFCQAYGIDPRLDEDVSFTLQRASNLPEFAARLDIGEEEFTQRLEHAHAALRAARRSRPRPAADDKVLVAWNGLAMRAFAEAARYLNRPDYLQAAQKCAGFILDTLYDGKRLLRSWCGRPSRQAAFLDDHGSLILALLALYQADFDLRWFNAARELAEVMIAKFADPAGGFFDTPSDLNDLPVRTKDFQDNTTPCGNSLAACALMLLEQFTGDNRYLKLAEAALPTLQDMLTRHPTAFGMWLQAADVLLAPCQQIALVTSNDVDGLAPFTARINRRWRPRTVLAAASLPLEPAAPELLHGRTVMNDRPTAYVCEQFTCKLPVNSPDKMDELIH